MADTVFCEICKRTMIFNGDEICDKCKAKNQNSSDKGDSQIEGGEKQHPRSNYWVDEGEPPLTTPDCYSEDGMCEVNALSSCSVAWDYGRCPKAPVCEDCGSTLFKQGDHYFCTCCEKWREGRVNAEAIKHKSYKPDNADKNDKGVND